eukprot:912414-Pyramimonas_sp.AAC.1
MLGYPAVNIAGEAGLVRARERGDLPRDPPPPQHRRVQPHDGVPRPRTGEGVCAGVCEGL